MLNLIRAVENVQPPMPPSLPPPQTRMYVMCVRMCVCYGFSACICPFCSFDLARPRSRFSFTHTHTHTCALFVDIIFRLLLSFCWFSFLFFSFSHRSPLIFCGVCGCLPRQRLECNLCSLAKCWAFLLLLPQTVLRFLLLGFRFMLIRIYCHLSFAWFTLIATSKPDQATPSHAKPRV